MNLSQSPAGSGPLVAPKRYLALAVDYDGTIAGAGTVSEPTLDALRDVAASGRKLVLVTGRELGDLVSIFPGITIFDRVVAENGARLFYPSTGVSRVIAPAPPPQFIAELIRRGVEPLSVGEVIVATVEPNETMVLETIRDLGLELSVIFNKGAVMVLPTNINKASGLKQALLELGLTPRDVVAVGDGENDHSMLELAAYSAAVANAVPALKYIADRTLAAEAGAGVIELVNDLLFDELGAHTSEASLHAAAKAQHQAAGGA